MRKNYLFNLLRASVLGGLFSFPVAASSQPLPEPVPFVYTMHFQGMQWRNAGPMRGGRSSAVCGIPQKPNTYFMGAAGGGLWQTEDGGLTWNNISDGFFSSASIGAIAVAPSDPNVVYAGTGEHSVRANMVFHGDGLYKSTDGGRTWKHCGLLHSRYIAAIRIHPQNPDILFVAVQGDVYAGSAERGVYRSEDGGRSWRRILYINPTTGAADLAMDHDNPRILYASMWDHQRTPWMIRSGGPGSGLYKSTDGGDNWEKLTNGLPASIGKAGVDVSKADPQRVYAVIEAENGGVFRSNDGGRSWSQINSDRITYARAWYYSKIVADPKHAETVYVLNAPLLRSIDGGRTFTSIENPHTDQHALWIHPEHPGTMILGNDGGATVTFNGGKSWSSQSNQPTAQLYRVIADNQYPYRLYAGQQDYGALAMISRSLGEGPREGDWHKIGPGESAFVAFDPRKPDEIFSTGYQGNINSFNTATQSIRDVMAYPTLALGGAPGDMKYRFNWSAPLTADPHQAGTLYHGAQCVLRTEDGGLSWKPISPDLTRNDLSRQGPGGGPFTNEAAGSENYNTLSYIACSPHQAGEIWAGSDDGLLHLTRNGGKQWQNITPPDLEEAFIQCIEVSPHHPGTAYVAALRQKFGDLHPYLFKTQDYGKTWTAVTQGLGLENLVHAVREDPVRPGLLYIGTHSGFYLSYDAGQNWIRFQLNMPVCPITDLTIADNDLIAATGGRSFWILDDLSALQQYRPTFGLPELGMVHPKPVFRGDASVAIPTLEDAYCASPPGMSIAYFLPPLPAEQEIRLQILNARQQVVRTFSSKADQTFQSYEGGPQAEPLLTVFPGLNRISWDLRRQSLPGVPKVHIHGDYRGGIVAPGVYTLRLISAGDTAIAQATVLPDPRTAFLPRDYQAQEEFLSELEHHIRDIHQSVYRMREVSTQIQHLIQYLDRAEEAQELVAAGQQVIQRIAEWETRIIQPLQKTPQDVINFPNRLSAELMDLKSRADSADPRLNQGMLARATDLKSQWSKERQDMQHILKRELDSFRSIFRQKDIPGLIIPGVTAF